MSALLESLALTYAKSKGLDYITDEARQYAAKLLGIDKQTQNPKYAISIGGNTFDLGNMAKKAGLNKGIESLMSGKLGGMMGPGLLLGGALMLGRAFDPTRPGSRNYNPTLAGQLADLGRRGIIGYDPNTGIYGKIMSGPLKGKNLISMFGTNDYGQMMDNKLGYFTDRIADGKNYSQKNYEDTLVESGAGGTRGSPTGPVSHAAEGIVSQADIDAFNATPVNKDYGNNGGGADMGSDDDGGEGGYGGFCFDPSTPIQMADGSEKKIKNIQLGDDTKGGEVTGVFQFKASDEIHNYKGVTVAGSHYVKEDGRFIMVKDSPLSTKINKIPVVYSLDTSGRRIFINDIEFADYNGDGVAKNFLNNAGVDLSGFDKEVLRQVEQRLI